MTSIECQPGLLGRHHGDLGEAVRLDRPGHFRSGLLDNADPELLAARQASYRPLLEGAHQRPAEVGSAAPNRFIRLLWFGAACLTLRLASAGIALIAAATG